MWCDIIYKIIHVFGATVLQVPNLRVWHPWVSFWRCLLIEVASKITWESIASIFTMPDNALIASLWAMLFMSFSSARWTMVNPVPMKCFERLWSFPVVQLFLPWESQAKVCPDWHHRPWYPPIFGGEQRYVGCFRRWNLHRRWQRNVQYIESLAWSFH